MQDGGKRNTGPKIQQIERIWNDFRSLSYEDPPCPVNDEQATLVNGDNASAPKTTKSFLYHAKIYVFLKAKSWQVEKLHSLRLFVICMRALLSGSEVTYTEDPT
jgi:hypothetical protein